MRIFTAGLATETNSFSPIPSGSLAFSLDTIRRARADEIAPPPSGSLTVYRDLCDADGHEVGQPAVRLGCRSRPACRNG